MEKGVKKNSMWSDKEQICADGLAAVVEKVEEKCGGQYSEKVPVETDRHTQTACGVMSSGAV